MLGMKAIIYTVVFILLANFAFAATVYGTVYDLGLKKVDNARIEINTSPKQFLVAQNGSYSFNVPNGVYTIKAQLMQKKTLIASVQENITINQNGDYILDLILFPNLEEGVENAELDINGDIVGASSSINWIWSAAVLLIILIVSFGIYYFIKFKKPSKSNPAMDDHKEIKKEFHDEDDELKNLIDLIKKENGRTTQKELRKQIPLSEAKIRLMIADLEHKGIIEKIKKGRGNIIILKKK